MREKKRRAPKINTAIAGGLVLLWAAVIFTYTKQPEIVIPPQIVYGATVETEAETETEAPSYSEEDLYLLSHVICGECNNCDWKMKTWVGSVVLNRVADPRFPSTLQEVIFQNNPLQYSCTVDGNFYKEPNEETIDAAKYLLENGSVLPENVIFQAEFKQGTGEYDHIKAPNGVIMYFCYG